LREKAFKRLEDYGIVGDLYTSALIGKDGSIDWCCLPHVESPSIFAALLDLEKGGQFRVEPAHLYESYQRYIDMTNVLQTVFRTAKGEAIITDFMPQKDTVNPGTQAIYRQITCIKGRMDFEVDFSPRFDYARAKAQLKGTEKGFLAEGAGQKLYLNSSKPGLKVKNNSISGKFTLREDETLWLVLGNGKDIPAEPQSCERERRETIEFWHRWVHSCGEGRCVFEGEWHDIIVRSSLVLKLLTHRQTGAICAAPTTSIPEVLGGVRNWDYRFNWLRDSSFTVRAFFSLGYDFEAKEFLRWFLDKFSAFSPGEIKTVYSLHGGVDLEEKELRHLSGYENSFPVRTGNAAHKQFQLDIYGELLQAVYDSLLFGLELKGDAWTRFEEIVNFVCRNWDEKDLGIWEVRSEPRHFVHSKLMCWVALDRGIKVVEKLGREAPRYWHEEREGIKAAILEKGFNTKLNSFVQSFDSEYMDATALLIPVMGLLPYEDPRVQGTIDAVMRELGHKGLIHRYNSPDGLPGREGTFVLCSLWLVDALAGSGRVEEALFNFNQVLEHASPLGLLAEEQDPHTGRQLGNFPQAYSHIGLINSALYLARAMKKEPAPATV